MIRIAKTINRRDAEERAERMREYIRLGKSSDTVEVKEFMTASGQPMFEVWLQHNKDLSRKA